jgi:4-amino-4-deoxy-L-arabinose transferase-like glycosyltransferase
VTVRQGLLLLVLASTAIRVVFAATTGLGVDESYMVAAGRQLSLGYFDHPPISWWLSWGGAHLFGTEAPLAVRLPFIALFAVSTMLMARLGAAVADERAGLWAAVLLNLSPVFGVTSASWVLPDGPLDGALLGAALCLVHALRDGRWRWWVGAGACAGLALASKYSAGLTILGAFGYLLAHRRAWLARPQPYVAAAVALLVFSPVIAWNAGHHWASFAFQGDRATGLRFQPLAPIGVLLGEGLFVLPWIWLPMMILLIRRRGLLAWLAAPPIVVFAAIAAWSSQRVLLHWAAPGYLMLFPYLGEAVAARLAQTWVRRTLIGTAALLVVAIAVISSQVSTDWLGGVLPRLVKRDPTIEGIDWTSVRDDLRARGLLRPGVVVGIPSWRDAGKLGYALGPGVTIVCLNPDARQFGFTQPVSAFVGQDMLLLELERTNGGPSPFTPWFDRIELLMPTSIRIGGRVLNQVLVAQGVLFRPAATR